MGLDAQAAYQFHRLRESSPWAAPTRLSNQAWYSYFSCISGIMGNIRRCSTQSFALAVVLLAIATKHLCCGLTILLPEAQLSPCPRCPRPRRRLVLRRGAPGKPSLCSSLPSPALCHIPSVAAIPARSPMPQAGSVAQRPWSTSCACGCGRGRGRASGGTCPCPAACGRWYCSISR